MNTDVRMMLEGYAAEPLDRQVPRSRVVDQLLDLRHAASGSPRMVRGIDVVLARLPGRDFVTRAWWTTEILTLQALVDHIGDEGRQ